jgi:hypothetical protein
MHRNAETAGRVLQVRLLAGCGAGEATGPQQRGGVDQHAAQAPPARPQRPVHKRPLDPRGVSHRDPAAQQSDEIVEFLRNGRCVGQIGRAQTVHGQGAGRDRARWPHLSVSDASARDPRPRDECRSERHDLVADQVQARRLDIEHAELRLPPRCPGVGRR